MEQGHTCLLAVKDPEITEQIRPGFRYVGINIHRALVRGFCNIDNGILFDLKIADSRTVTGCMGVCDTVLIYACQLFAVFQKRHSTVR